MSRKEILDNLYDPPHSNVGITKNNKTDLSTAIKWAGYFALPIFVLIVVEFILINSYLKESSLDRTSLLKMLGMMAGQFGIILGVYLSALFISLNRISGFTSMAVWSVIHAFLWVLLFLIGWELMIIIKLKRLQIGNVSISFDLLLLWFICYFYSLLESSVLVWRINKVKQNINKLEK